MTKHEYSVEEVRDWHRRQARACAPFEAEQAQGALHDDMADAIERAKAWMTDEVVETALQAYIDESGIEDTRSGDYLPIDDDAMRAALQAVAHLLPSSDGGVVTSAPKWWTSETNDEPITSERKIEMLLLGYPASHSALHYSIPLYAHPPAQAAQVDKAQALAHFTDYFVRNYPGPNTIISDPNWHAPKIFRAAMYAIENAMPAAPTAEPVVQGDASWCTEDNSSLCRKAAGNLSMLLSLCREQLHPDECATAQEIICGLQAAQPRAVPDGWVLVPREPTTAMLDSAQRSNEGKQLPRFSVLRKRWTHMLAAAPSPGDPS